MFGKLGKKDKGNPYEEDRDRLMSLMEAAIGGDLTAVDEAAFHDPELAKRYNALLESVLRANNVFVMRLNDSMTRIGDSSVVKTMIEEVNAQTGSAQTIRTSGQELGNSIMNIQSFAQSIQSKSAEVQKASDGCTGDMNESIRVITDSSEEIQRVSAQMSEFRKKAEDIGTILDQIKNLADNSSLLALNASIEAARAGEAGRGFAIVAQQMGELSNQTTACADDVGSYIEDLMQGIGSLANSVEVTTKHLAQGAESVDASVKSLAGMSEQLGSIGTDIDSIYDEISNQSALTQEFVAIGTTIAESYERLYDECIKTGEHLYHISRDIDNARSDMARQRSHLTMQDWLHVFEIDHLIFTWRLYNNIVGFEHLKITQLNNPKGCKLGKWIEAQTDPKLTGLAPFRKVRELHEELHRHAVDSWNANEDGSRELAMEHFERAYQTYTELLRAFGELKDAARSVGYRDVTDFAKKK